MRVIHEESGDASDGGDWLMVSEEFRSAIGEKWRDGADSRGYVYDGD
jgi:hypothetical protein